MFTLKHVSARPPFNLRGLRLFHTCVGNFSNKRDELNDFRGDWRIVLSELINNHGRTSYLRKVFARTKAKRVFTAQVRMYIYIYIYIYTGSPCPRATRSIRSLARSLARQQRHHKTSLFSGNFSGIVTVNNVHLTFSFSLPRIVNPSSTRSLFRS